MARLLVSTELPVRTVVGEMGAAVSQANGRFADGYRLSPVVEPRLGKATPLPVCIGPKYIESSYKCCMLWDMSRQDPAGRRRDRRTGRAFTGIGSALYGLAIGAVRRSPRELSLTSAATLATLDRTGPRRVTDLAAAQGITQPSMTVLVRAMEESGLVERRGDASDRRVTLVCLTEAGVLYVRSRRRAGVHGFVRLIDKLADDEAEALMAALPALQHLAALDSQDREGPTQ